MLFQKIKKDIIQAMKDKNGLKRDLLRTLAGDCCKMTKEPDDAACVATIKSFVKKIDNEVLPHIEEHTTAWDKAMTEIAILTSYLPKQLDEVEIAVIISFLKQDNPDMSLGDIMKHFKTRCEGRYDGAVVSRIAKEMPANG